MKRITSLLLVTILSLTMLFACTDGNITETNNNSNNKSSIDSALTGVWFCAFDSTVLDIKDDGTGTVTYKNENYNGSFSAEKGIFSVKSDVYSFSGEYTLENDQLITEVIYENENYTVVFSRTKIAIPEELEGAHVYKIGEEAYEITLTEEKTTCKGLPFPPSDDYPEIEIYIIPEGPSEPKTESKTEAETDSPTTPKNNPPSDYKVLPTPPDEIFKSPKTDSTNPTKPDSTDIQTETKQPTVNTEPAETKPLKDKDTSFIPETISSDGENVKVSVKGETIKTTKGGGSIVGTWTSAQQEGTAYIFGYTTNVPYTVTFTFNADGTGTVTALFFTGTVNWTLNGSKLTTTISMLGDTETGSADITIIGDVMYFVNNKGERHTLSRSN